MTDKDLLPCPFCSAGIEHVYVNELARRDKAIYDKNGKLNRRIEINHHVECCNCGALGPSSFGRLDEDILTEQHITDSIQMAALSWNVRGTINNKAFELVNKLITSAFEKK